MLVLLPVAHVAESEGLKTKKYAATAAPPVRAAITAAVRTADCSRV
jgi:hypothetical protein